MTEFSYCGIKCAECPAFIATQNNDDKLRTETAAAWSKEFNANIQPEGINCDGCHADTGRLFAHCHECEYRLCAMEKGVETCAHCTEYACEKLSKFFEWVPSCKENLDGVKAALA